MQLLKAVHSKEGIMKRNSRNKPALPAPWLAYTDLLSSTLMILTVTLVMSALAKFVNQKPPIIRLSDESDFRFSTGSYSINDEFRNKLVSEQLPEIKRVIRCYGIDTIELVGHTDANPNQGISNLDTFKTKNDAILSAKAVRSGSNADLGLLRAISVERLLKQNLTSYFPRIKYKSYSASSYIDPMESYSVGAKTEMMSEKSKRRIEVRFTRSDTSKVIPRC
jgi:outer membrane protein OmpA-like peptidoglycan-associated protein